ncbi:MAG TPA: hypothetical protein P5089_00455 [Candidatus Portnoybacteria bacterium]|nr:hypothetical protein [Candidatus Portnoybacteria bacterium]
MKDFVYKDITRDNIPCWYKLDWQEKPPAIMLSIHQDFIKNNTRILKPELPLIKHFQKEFNFDSFCGELNKDFGFNSAFLYQGEKDNFAEYLIPIPKIKQDSGKKCPRCQGKGKQKTFGYLENCYDCNGTGKDFFYDWQKAQAASASLSVIFALLEFPEKETSEQSFQLIIFRTMTERGMHGGSLGGKYSPILFNWLLAINSELAESLESKSVSAMKDAYYQMFFKKEDNFLDYDFRFRITNGRFSLDCPGNACGVHPTSFDNRSEFTCHNVDSAAQQLTLLAGLAVLNSSARQSL